MRNTANLPSNIAEIQLSSPLPSPSRYLTNNNNTPNSLNNSNTDNTHHKEELLNPASISTLANPIQLPPLIFESSHNLNPDLYPLSTLETPKSLKKFTFTLDGKTNLFEEIQTVTARKRSASNWDDERSFKRTELDTHEDLPSFSSSANTINNNSSNATVNTFSPGPPTSDMVDIIPDSPNSALPSPVSDLDHDDSWSNSLSPHHKDEEYQDSEQEDQQQLSKSHYSSNNNTVVNLQHSTNSFIKNCSNTTLLDPSTLIEMFDVLPDRIQSYFMYQILKRSPRHTLRMANDTIMQVLKLDFIQRLPQALAIHILSYLDVRSLCRATGVSQSWKYLIDNASDVWKQKLIELDITCDGTNYKEKVRRHTIIQRNWRDNRHKKMPLEGHEDDLVTCLQFDDEKIITGSDDHSINVYDIKTGQLKRALNGHEGGVWALQYVGNTLVTGSIDRTVRIWNIETGKCHYILRGHSSTVRCLKIVMPAPVVRADGTVAIEPSKPIIVSGSRDMTIRVWNLPDITKEEPELSNSVEHDEVSRYFSKYKLEEHEHSVRDLAVYGNTLVSGSYDNNVIVWNLETGKKVHVLQGHTMKVYCVAIDPKRRHCISGSLDASIRIWDLDTGECKFVLQGHAILVGLLGLVDDCLVSAAADATLRIWDPSNGDRLQILAGPSGHQGPITSFQHDKYKIISGSEGGVKMWDTKTGKFLYNLIEDVEGVWRVCFDKRRCIAAVKNEHKTQLIVLDFGVHGLEEE